MSFDPNARADNTCVRFTVHLPEGDSDAAISAKALVEGFGATMTPEGLLKCYRDNAHAIHAAARHMGQPTSDGRLLVTAADFDAWTRSAPRGGERMRRKAATARGGRQPLRAARAP